MFPPNHTNGRTLRPRPRPPTSDTSEAHQSETESPTKRRKRNTPSLVGPKPPREIPSEPTGTAQTHVGSRSTRASKSRLPQPDNSHASHTFNEATLRHSPSPLHGSIEDTDMDGDYVDSEHSLEESAEGSFAESSAQAQPSSRLRSQQKTHVCGECGRSFSRPSELKKHVDGVHKKIRYVCKQCPRRFYDKSILAEHIRDVHENPSTKVCEVCGLTFGTQRNLNAHFAAMHKNRATFSCGQCDRTFNTNSTLSEHIRGVHDQTIRCEECDKVYATSQGLTAHINRVHKKLESKRATCDHCQKEYNKGDLPRHIKTAHPEVITTACNFCHQTFAGPRQLSQHNRDTHAPDMVKVCSSCSKSFPGQAALDEHINKAHTQTLYTCDICTRTFAKPSDYRRHMESPGHANAANARHIESLGHQAKTPDRSGDTYCEACGKMISKNYYKTHVTTQGHLDKARIWELEQRSGQEEETPEEPGEIQRRDDADLEETQREGSPDFQVEDDVDEDPTQRYDQNSGFNGTSGASERWEDLESEDDHDFEEEGQIGNRGSRLRMRMRPNSPQVVINPVRSRPRPVSRHARRVRFMEEDDRYPSESEQEEDEDELAESLQAEIGPMTDFDIELQAHAYGPLGNRPETSQPMEYQQAEHGDTFNGGQYSDYFESDQEVELRESLHLDAGYVPPAVKMEEEDHTFLGRIPASTDGEDRGSSPPFYPDIEHEADEQVGQDEEPYTVHGGAYEEEGMGHYSGLPVRRRPFIDDDSDDEEERIAPRGAGLVSVAAQVAPVARKIDKNRLRELMAARKTSDPVEPGPVAPAAPAAPVARKIDKNRLRELMAAKRGETFAGSDNRKSDLW